MDIRSKNTIRSEFNMASMTDVVFLLLIFFMLLSTLVNTNAIDIVLPKAHGKTSNAKSVSVTITNKFDYYIDKTSIGEDNLELELLKIFENQKDASLIIRAEENVPISKVVKLMDFANKNNLKTILATQPKE